MPNVYATQWDAELSAPFSAKMARVAAHAGARALGAAVYEIAPGGAVSPYHAHSGNEELLVVLSGRPRLRTPDGTATLEPGDVASFPPGPEGAHRVSNAGPELARVLLVSTMSFPEIAEHLDTGTWLAMTGPQEGKVFPAGTDVPVMEALGTAMAAGAERDG